MSAEASSEFAATVYVSAPHFDGVETEIEGDRYRHLFRSRRLASGDVLRAVDGCGRSRKAIVGRVVKDRATLELGDPLPSRELPRTIELWIASPRPERASWLVEKATELGVGAVRWLRSERSPRRYGEGILARQKRVAISALQQCGGARLPELSGPHEWTALPALAGSGWMLDLAGARCPALGDAAEAVTVVVGPEGGFASGELADLAELGCRRWCLGDRILRVETAAIVAAGVLANASAGP